jgi:NADH:ubiquinone reductase (non-electrogenic)
MPAPCAEREPRPAPGAAAPKSASRDGPPSQQTDARFSASPTATYISANPGEQLDQDPKKKNVVVLGSGWGATAFLKGLDNEEYNVTVISPHNYFLYTPLLPSVTVGTLEGRSIIQPTRFITRHKKRKVTVVEAEAKEVDPVNKTVTFVDNSDVKGTVESTTIPYDYLVYALGCDNQTFGMAGVPKYACFLKELSDADKVRQKIMDCTSAPLFVLMLSPVTG